MAWNEPGDKGRDPWGGGNKNDGPPDLDDALKQLNDRLRGLFGGGSGKAGKGEMKRLQGQMLLICSGLIREQPRVGITERDEICMASRHYCKFYHPFTIGVFTKR